MFAALLTVQKAAKLCLVGLGPDRVCTHVQKNTDSSIEAVVVLHCFVPVFQAAVWAAQPSIELVEKQLGRLSPYNLREQVLSMTAA